MKPVSLAFWFCILIVSLITGCADPDHQVAPNLLEEPGAFDNSSGSDADFYGRSLWAYNLVTIDSLTLESEIHPIRLASEHWNILSWLEYSPCLNCLKVTEINPSGTGTLLVTVEINHPFVSDNLTGFDVRGTVIFTGSATFPVSGLVTADRYLGDGEVVNPDGFTTLYNPETLGAGPNGLQGYINGKLASPEVPVASLNSYKRFISEGPENTRNAFYANHFVSVTYELDMPDGPWVFGYAVDANWARADNIPVEDPMADFPSDANCPEPWKIEITEVNECGGLTPDGGSTKLVIDVYDWQDLNSYSVPVVECPGILSDTVTCELVEDYGDFARWEADITNQELGGIGIYQCLVSVEDQENDPVLKPWLDLTAYAMIRLEVKEPVSIEGWARSWDYGSGIAFYSHLEVDPSGDIYVITAGSSLFKYSPNGDLIWDYEMVSGNYNGVGGLEVCPDGSICMAGWFEGTCDFDPGDGTEYLTAADNMDPYIAKWSGSGDLIWAKSWTAPYVTEMRLDVCADSAGNIFTTGQFYNTVDFDPGPGVDEKISGDGTDAYLAEYDAGGNYIQCTTWGGERDCQGEFVSSGLSDRVYVSGESYGQIDYDPGPGVDLQGDEKMVFISCFDSNTVWQWARTWTSYTPRGLEIDGTGNIYIGGHFRGVVDFDPGDGVDEHGDYPDGDSQFISKFNYDGIYQWVTTWALLSTGTQLSDICVDSSGNCYGYWFVHHDEPPKYAVINRYSPSGELTWSNEQPVQTFSQAIASDLNCGFYTTGYFGGTVDFDPGPGVDEHTSPAMQWGVFLARYNSDFTW